MKTHHFMMVSIISRFDIDLHPIFIITNSFL